MAAIMDSSLVFLAIVYLSALLRPTTAAQLRVCAKETQQSHCKSLEAATSEVRCVHVEDSVDCSNLLDVGAADFGLFTAEEALVAAAAGRTHKVVAEARHQNRGSDEFQFRTVVVVRANHEGGVAGLKGKNYCHPGFSKIQYWTDPVLKALELAVIGTNLECKDDLTTVEQETKALSNFFTKACRPNAWTVNKYRDDKLKSTYRNLCALCDSPYECQYNTDRVGAYDAAMACLTEKGADVVYNALSVVRNYFDNVKGNTSKTDYSFLCPDGSLQSLDASNPCTWVRQPWPAILASSRNANEINGKLKDMFQDDVARALAWQQRLKLILAGDTGILKISTVEDVTAYISKGRPIDSKQPGCGRDIKWCTTSEDEKKKCQVVAVAAATHGISPRISCPPIAANATHCLKFVNGSDADIAVIPTNDGFVARRAHNLQPVMYLESERKSNYGGIVVVHINSTIKSTADLSGKRACFPSFNGLGWLTYMKLAWGSEALPSTACPASHKTLHFFGKSCAPGVNDKNINVANVTVPHSLCAGCSQGPRSGSCDSSITNPYYGELGALKCITEGAGDVAFLDYNAAVKLLGRRPGAHDRISASNIRVLCKDGTKVELKEDLNQEKCIRTEVIGSEVVSRKLDSKSRWHDIQYVLEEVNFWFGSNRPDTIIKLFGKYNNNTNVLLPSTGVDLINVYSTQGAFVGEYNNLHSKLQHCSSASGRLVPLNLLGSFLAAMLFFNLICISAGTF